MRRKIGLQNTETEDADLINAMFDAMEGQNVDYTQFFRNLATAADGNSAPLEALFDDPADITNWLEKWQDRCQRAPLPPTERAAAMDQVNPIYIARNHKVEEALQAATKGDLAPFKRLLDLLQTPFSKRQGFEDYESSAPEDFGPYTTFCGT